jgi:hypothetical protein
LAAITEQQKQGTRTIQARLTVPVLARLDALVGDEFVSRSDAARRLIVEGLDRRCGVSVTATDVRRERPFSATAGNSLSRGLA